MKYLEHKLREYREHIAGSDEWWERGVLIRKLKPILDIAKFDNQKVWERLQEVQQLLIQMKNQKDRIIIDNLVSDLLNEEF